MKVIKILPETPFLVQDLQGNLYIFAGDEHIPGLYYQMSLGKGVFYRKPLRVNLYFGLLTKEYGS